MPHAEDPPVREAESQEETPSQKTQITNEEYHFRSDQFLESLLSKLEARQEEKGDIDVEYSVSFTYFLWLGLAMGADAN
jgi:frataxin